MNDSQPDKTPDANKPDIHIDEDWKNQVQAEKQALDAADDPAATLPDRGQFPEASFSMLVTTLATQAMMALGQNMTPDATEVSVDLGLAKHLIDTLNILEDKTQGNLAAEESAMLTSVLHQLRMLFVAMQEQVQAQPDKPSSIELP